MISAKRTHAAILAAISTLIVAACGGGGDAGPDRASAAAVKTSGATSVEPTLSANQQIFEAFILAPSEGSYFLYWNLPYSGNANPSTYYAFSDFGLLTASPLTNGPQLSAQSAPHNITTTLGLPTPGVTRVLKNGAVIVAGTVNQVSYVDADVRVDTLSADNTTVAFSEIRSNYETVALTGLVKSAPADFAHFHNSFFSNANILEATANYAPGAAYLKFAQTNQGDRYHAFDCTTATTGTNITPCRTATTLTAALTAGIVSNSDGTTYRLANGSITTVDGVSVWVATNPRPQSATLSSTVQYRIYFALNGNVYTGGLTKDGTLLGGSYYVSNPSGTTVTDRLTFLPFDIRMNKAAHDSIAAAMKI